MNETHVMRLYTESFVGNNLKLSTSFSDMDLFPLFVFLSFETYWVFQMRNAMENIRVAKSFLHFLYSLNTHTILACCIAKPIALYSNRTKSTMAYSFMWIEKKSFMDKSFRLHANLLLYFWCFVTDFDRFSDALLRCYCFSLNMKHCFIGCFRNFQFVAYESV